MVHGQNAAGPALVELLQSLHPFEVGRYRDAWVEHEGDSLLIRIHTRNGGGNREDYEAENESMAAHPWYVRDADDDFDRTYADFWFRVDLAVLEPDIARVLVEMAQAPVDVGERWKAAIDAIGHDPSPGRGSTEDRPTEGGSA